MTSQQATVPRVNTSATKLLRLSFRVVWAAVVFVAVCFAWLVLFLLFAPFLLVAEVIRLIKGDRREEQAGQAPLVDLPSSTDSTVPLIFDRRHDVSKLYGCNTRSVRYRWSLFQNRLDLLQRQFEAPVALDFGAGSLRDSYELSLHGFKVVSFDLNDRILRRYFDSYDWSQTRSRPLLMSGSFEDLVSHFVHKRHKTSQKTPMCLLCTSTDNAPDSVQLVIAFDVIEHLNDPAYYVQAFSKILCEDGFLFTIVPNRRSLFERYFKHSLAQQVKRGIVPEPGVPHVQFRSPEEWDQFFQANGFRIVDRDMTIGHFVNDWWNGLLSIPLRTYVYPVLELIAYRGKFQLDVGKIESTLCAPWLMERVNVLDQLLKRWTNCCFGWNLIVAQKRSAGAP